MSKAGYFRKSSMQRKPSATRFGILDPDIERKILGIDSTYREVAFVVDTGSIISPKTQAS
jgi:hypothetical protein